MSLYTDPTHLIGGDADCRHEERSYLGQMGLTALFLCERCGGVLTAPW